MTTVVRGGHGPIDWSKDAKRTLHEVHYVDPNSYEDKLEFSNGEADVAVYMDHVIILGHKIKRPTRISRTNWRNYWSRHTGEARWIG